MVSDVKDTVQARAVLAAGGDAIGLLPFDDIISTETATSIATSLPDAQIVIGTRLTNADEIVDLARGTGGYMLELIEFVHPHQIGTIRRGLPGFQIMKTIPVGNDSSIESVMNYIDLFFPLVDAIQPDTVDRITGRTGGAGVTHDWDIAAAVVAKYGKIKPVILAGGLTPSNVGLARARVGPTGVNVSSGVKSDRTLDYGKLEAFVRACRTPEGPYPIRTVNVRIDPHSQQLT